MTFALPLPTRDPPEMICSEITLCGARMVLDPSGVLFVPETCTLIVSDLHLEKGSCFATRRQMLPPYDTSITLARLEAALQRHRPKRVVALGDSFHDVNGPERLRDTDRSRLRAMTSAHEWVWVLGNHDPLPPQGLGGVACKTIEISGVCFRHEPTTNPIAECAGHLHPCVVVRGRAGSVRRRAFLVDERRLILPAFGAFTGGLNALDPAFAPYFAAQRFTAWALGETRVHPIRRSALL